MFANKGRITHEIEEREKKQPLLFVFDNNRAAAGSMYRFSVAGCICYPFGHRTWFQFDCIASHRCEQIATKIPIETSIWWAHLFCNIPLSMSNGHVRLSNAIWNQSTVVLFSTKRAFTYEFRWSGSAFGNAHCFGMISPKLNSNSIKHSHCIRLVGAISLIKSSWLFCVVSHESVATAFELIESYVRFLCAHALHINLVPNYEHGFSKRYSKSDVFTMQSRFLMDFWLLHGFKLPQR